MYAYSVYGAYQNFISSLPWLGSTIYICRLLNLQPLSFPFQIGDHVSLIIPNQGKLTCSLKLVLISASLSI